MDGFVRRVRGARRSGDDVLEVSVVEADPEPLEVVEDEGLPPRAQLIRLGALVVVIVLVGVLGISILRNAGAPTIDDLRREAGWNDLQTLSVGVTGDVPGLSDCRGADCTGFDVEIAKLVADWLGVPRTKVAFAEVLPEDRNRMEGRDLRTGKSVNLDLVAAAFSITKQRVEDEGVVFAGPYLTTQTTILTRNDHPAVESLSGLDAPLQVDGRTVARQRVCTPGTSTSAAYLRAELRTAEIIPLQRNSRCVQLLREKQVDAVVTDAAILAGFQQEFSSELRMNNIASTTDERWGIGLGIDLTGENEELQARKQLVSLALEDLLEAPGQESWRQAFAMLPATADTPDSQVVADDRQPAPIDLEKVRRWPWERSGEGSGR